MNQLEKISKKEIENLKDLVEKIEKTIKNNKIAKRFEIHKKFKGHLGEAYGLIKLYEKYGQKYEYYWKGGHQKGYDLSIKKIKSDKKMKIQIKSGTSSNDEYFSFIIFNIENMKNRETKNLVKNKKWKRLSDLVCRKIEEKGKDIADYWLLVKLSPKTNIYYLLKREQIIRLLKNECMEYYAKKHRKKFNGAIGKNGVIQLRLTSKVESTKNKINRYKI